MAAIPANTERDDVGRVVAPLEGGLILLRVYDSHLVVVELKDEL